MTVAEILSHVDHTLLKADARWEDIRTLCEEAIRYHTASVCIPPSYVGSVRETYGESITICTVVGFPLGYSVTAAKEAEVRTALAQGCDEIDMVINIADAKNGRFDRIEAEIKALKQLCGSRILKVIIETCYLDADEKIRLCQAVTAAGADFIKTSTGFGTGGAAIADVELLKQHIGEGVKIKAAGGVATAADLELFLAAGCERIGTSKAVALLQGQQTTAEAQDGY